MKEDFPNRRINAIPITTHYFDSPVITNKIETGFTTGTSSWVIRTRRILICDLVFFILVWLMLSELHDEVISDSLLWQKLAFSIPKIVDVIVSLFVIGLYWISHHKLFGYVTVNYRRLLWPNLLFLLTIIFMPFTTAILSEHYDPGLTMPVILYGININLFGLAGFRLWSVATNSKYNLSSISHNKVLKRYHKSRALTIPTVFLLVILLSFVSGWIPFLLLPFIPVVTYFIKRYFWKKYAGYREEF